jgi:hypothetical protein
MNFLTKEEDNSATPVIKENKTANLTINTPGYLLAQIIPKRPTSDKIKPIRASFFASNLWNAEKTIIYTIEEAIIKEIISNQSVYHPSLWLGMPVE